MAWILGVLILLAMGAFCVWQYQQSKSDADRYDLSGRTGSGHGSHNSDGG